MASKDPAVETARDRWVGIGRAADLVGCSPYSIQKYALAGSIRTRLIPPFKTVFCLEDLEKLAQSFALS